MTADGFVREWARRRRLGIVHLHRIEGETDDLINDIFPLLYGSGRTRCGQSIDKVTSHPVSVIAEPTKTEDGLTGMLYRPDSLISSVILPDKRQCEECWQTTLVVGSLG